MQEAKWKDKMNGDMDMESMLDNGRAYLHPAIRSSSVDSESDYPDTIRNGTAPRGGESHDSRTPSTDHVVGMPSRQSSGEDSWSNSVVHRNREENPSNNASYGRFNHVHGVGSSAKVLAGDSLPSSPPSRIHHLGGSRTWASAGTVETPHSSFRSLPTDLDVAGKDKVDI